MTKEAAQKRIEALTRELNHHNHLYYIKSQPEISDFEFDRLLEELVALEREFPEFADANSSKLYRVTPEGTKVYPVRLKDILDKGDIKTNYPVLPGDIVTIPEKLF